MSTVSRSEAKARARKRSMSPARAKALYSGIASRDAIIRRLLRAHELIQIVKIFPLPPPGLWPLQAVKRMTI